MCPLSSNSLLFIENLPPHISGAAALPPKLANVFSQIKF